MIAANKKRVNDLTQKYDYAKFKQRFLWFPFQ
ncbi:hypothetical protein BRW83_0112 [Oxalobacter formigenes]|nr:hypothetical protein BRW83_0112 [Oxalobacter formigenes]